MRSSRYYQNWLQIISRSSTIFMFLSGFYLGKGEIMTALIMLGLKLVTGYSISELMYKRMRAVVREENAQRGKHTDTIPST